MTSLLLAAFMGASTASAGELHVALDTGALAIAVDLPVGVHVRPAPVFVKPPPPVVVHPRPLAVHRPHPVVHHRPAKRVVLVR